MCLIGSLIIVLHAPPDKEIQTLLSTRCIDDDGRGIGTPCDGIGILCVGRGANEYTTEVLGEDKLDVDRRCVGCEYGSGDESPTRLSTDNPSFPEVDSSAEYSLLHTVRLTRRLCSKSSSR